ncbi:GRAS family protein [Selaginella moellendorffii]|uniref:GRAS family protein n=2 Tax=Selaginella moellendorffii TaxID=88036 RepID=D8S0H1_SELML|nr:GRAS family protein [Selaginella moellendorffii]
MEELERMLLSPSSGGMGGAAAAANQHHQQLAKWLLGDAAQQDHHFFPAIPAKEEEPLFFPQASAPNPSLAFAESRHLPLAIQPQPSLLSPPRPKIIQQHQDIGLEQLFHPVDPPHFAANPGPGHELRSIDRSPSRNFQAQQQQGRESPGWELDRKRKEHYPEIPDLSSKNRAPYSSSTFAVPLAVESRSISPWQQQQRQEFQEHHRDLPPNPKLQCVRGGGDDRHRHGRGGSGSGSGSGNGRDPSAIAFGSGFGSGAPVAASSNPGGGGAGAGIPSVLSVPDEGLGLMDQLLHLAQAIDVGSNHVAQSILARLNQHLFCHQGKRIQRLAFYFKEALAARMIDHHPATTTTTTTTSATTTPAEIFAKVRAYTSFCEISPLLRFAYLSANQAILEAIQGEASVHIVDFDPGFGSQWAALLEDVARTPAALPQPRLRLTLVGPDPARLGFVVESLREFAGELHLRHTPQFGLVQCAAAGEMTPPLLGLTDGEPVVVNFMFSLHRSLAARGGTDAAVSAVMTASPRLVTIAEEEVDDNDGKFQRRFVETLQYYAFVLDSLGPEDGAGVLTVEKDILSPGIANAVSLEGARRTERHERLAQWRARLGRGGLEPVPMGEAARMQAECLIKGHSHGKNFEVCRDEGGLLLGWQGKPLVAVSSWTPASSSSAVEGSNNINNSLINNSIIISSSVSNSNIANNNINKC